MHTLCMMNARLLFLLSVMTMGVFATDECRGIKRDLMILVDASTSVTQTNFNKSKDFLVDIIRELTIGNDGFQVGLIRFSDSLFPEAELGKFNDKTELINAIRGINYNGGGTNTGRAIWVAMMELGRSSNREDVPDQIITLTDGESDNQKNTARQIEATRAKNIEMISIGVGPDINKEELRSLASNESLMYVVDSYDDIDSIKSQLVASSCGATRTSFKTQPTTLPITATTTTETSAKATTKKTQGSAKTVSQTAEESLSDETCLKAKDLLPFEQAALNILKLEREKLTVQEGLQALMRNWLAVEEKRLSLEEKRLSLDEKRLAVEEKRLGLEEKRLN